MSVGLAHGQRIGPYRIDRPLGRGGVATVYLAHDEHGVAVALKVLHPQLQDQPIHVAGFRREATMGLRVPHPAVLHPIGQPETEGLPKYFAMEYFEGCSASTLLKYEHTFTEQQALIVAYRIGTALEYAHRQGVLHRDVKPANIMINLEGAVCLADFGLAQLIDSQVDDHLGFAGTPAYCSPEQLRGEPLSSMADIYSLGITLFELLAGEPPYTGPTPVHVLEQIEGGAPPSLFDYRTDVSLRTMAMLDALISPDPSLRISCTKEMVDTLEQRVRDFVKAGRTPLALEEALRVYSKKAFAGVVRAAMASGSAEDSRPDDEATIPGNGGRDTLPTQ